MLTSARWIGLTLTALAVIVAFGGLSWWQWERAQRDEPGVVAPVAASEIFLAGQVLADASYGTRVEITGVYDRAHQLLVRRGPATFWIVTTLRPESGAAVAIARGIVSSPQDPSVSDVPAGVVTVAGVAQPFEGDPGTPPESPAGQADRLTEAALALPYVVASGWIALESQTPRPSHLLPSVPVAFGQSASSSLRLQNAMYAVQWVLFAAFVVFFWARMLRFEVRGVTTAPPAAPSSPVREVY